MSVRILFVGASNTGLSAMAEGLLKKMLSEKLGGQADNIEVTSCGLTADALGPANPYMTHIARSMGLDLSRHRSQPLLPQMVDGADLILTMETKHMDGVIRLFPTSVDKVFTLREFTGGRSLIEEVFASDIPDDVADNAVPEHRHHRFVELRNRYFALASEIARVQEELIEIGDSLHRDWYGDEAVARLTRQLALFDLPDPNGMGEQAYRDSVEDVHGELQKLVVRLIHND